MYTIEEFIIAVFCCVDDWLKAVIIEHPVRSKGFAPALSDSEVMTMEIVAEYQGIDSDSAIWQYFRRHWWAWFPGLGSRSAFVRQAANLWQYKAMLQQHIAKQLGAYEDDIHLHCHLIGHSPTASSLSLPLIAILFSTLIASLANGCPLLTP